MKVALFSDISTTCYSVLSAASAKIPLMSAFTLSESTLLGAAGKEFLFKLSPSERVEGQALAAALNHLNYTSVSNIWELSVELAEQCLGQNAACTHHGY